MEVFREEPACRIGSDVMRLNINGELTDTTIIEKILLISDAVLTIGNAPTRPRGLKGGIDEIRIWVRYAESERSSIEQLENKSEE